jgi:hypothetical protein
MALSKRTQKFIADARKKQGDFGKRRKAVRNRIGPMTESESKAYSSPSKNVPKQGKKSYDNIPVTTQLDMMRRSVQRYDRRDFDNKRFAQGLAGQKSVTSPRPRVRKPNPIQMGTGPNAPKREPSKKKGAMQRFLEGKGAIGRKKGGKTSRRRGPFG